MNSKIVFLALVASFCLLTVNALPIAEEDLIEQGAIEVQGPRQKRVTCDLLSASIKGVQLNHSACAAHCLVLGKKGGYCNNGVCNCRN